MAIVEVIDAHDGFEVITDRIKTTKLVTLLWLIGIASAIVDNVPLVAASMGMYPLSQYPTDSFIWEFMAYAAGAGGSILIIGSAAGVAAMGLEKIEFFWYVKKISLLALLGYFAGAVVYVLLWVEWCSTCAGRKLIVSSST